MSRPICLLSSVVALSLLAGAAGAREEKIKVDQCPKAVKAAILAEAGSNPVLEVEREARGGTAFYEAMWKIDGREHEVKVGEDGSVLAREQEIALDEAPAAVKKTVTTEAGAHKIESVERRVAGTTTTYKAEWAADGKTVLLRVAADGSILGRRVEEGDED